MRCQLAFLAALALAGCTHGSDHASPTTAPTPKDRAASLCHSTVPHPERLVSSDPTTVGLVRSAPIGTVGPSQSSQFPTLKADDFAAWCWTRDGATFHIYRVAPGTTAHLVVSEVGIDPSSAHGAPSIP